MGPNKELKKLLSIFIQSTQKNGLLHPSPNIRGGGKAVVSFHRPSEPSGHPPVQTPRGSKGLCFSLTRPLPLVIQAPFHATCPRSILKQGERLSTHLEHTISPLYSVLIWL